MNTEEFGELVQNPVFRFLLDVANAIHSRRQQRNALLVRHVCGQELPPNCPSNSNRNRGAS